MKLGPIFTRSKDLIRSVAKHLDRQEISGLYRSGSRQVKRAALQKLSHLLLSGRIGLKTAHYVLPNDILSAVTRFWGVAGNLKEIDLKQLAQEIKSPDILASLAENPEVSLIAAKNEYCPWLAAAQALSKMPPDNVSTYPLEEAYSDKSIEHVRDVIWSHPASMNKILNYIKDNNTDLYDSLRLTPMHSPRIVK
jgi:hypothetical protein